MTERRKTMDYASFKTLVERSSIGEPGATALRKRTSTGDALRVMTAAEKAYRKILQEQPWLELTDVTKHQVCLDEAVRGNRLALDVLVADLTPLVWHVARGHGLTRSASEEVVQDVWLLFLRHIDNIKTGRKLIAWLVVAARRCAIAIVRDHPTTSIEVEQVSESFENERDRKLWAAFARLPRRCQELLRLTVLAGRAEYSTVAAALSLPVGAVGPTRGRCLKLLRKELEIDGEKSQPSPEEQKEFFVVVSQMIEEADPVPVVLINHLAG